MIRRLSAVRPASNGRLRPGPTRMVRLLAVSDEIEPALEFEKNRTGLQPIDAIIGAGDLKPEYLDFLAGAFCVPLLYVLGNHDRGGGWDEEKYHVPDPIDGAWHNVAGLNIAGLSWPSDARQVRAIHDENAAWRQVAARYLRLRGRRPDIIVSHVPPLGLGDTPEDHYHRGFAAYRWLIDKFSPLLWLHGHTAPAATAHWWVREGSTTVVNVTGAVLIEVIPESELSRSSSAEPEEQRTTQAAQPQATGDARRRKATQRPGSHAGTLEVDAQQAQPAEDDVASRPLRAQQRL